MKIEKFATSMVLKNIFTFFLCAAILGGIPGGTAVVQAKFSQIDAGFGTGFTYQGYLQEAGQPVQGVYDFEFKLYDAFELGGLIGTNSINDVPISRGLFSVELDFGASLDGTALWLEIAVRPGISSSAFTILGPRQVLNPTPYAVYAAASQNSLALGGVDAAGYQERIMGTCAAGSTVQAVNKDGSVVCFAQSQDPRPTFNLAALDTQDQVGMEPAIILGSDGLGLVSYYDATNGDLKVAHCSNAACSTASIYTLDSPGDVGRYSSITIGADNLGLISYFDATSKALKVAHCKDLLCSAADLYMPDPNVVAGFTSIAIGADGLGLISYFSSFTFGGGSTAGFLKIAHCDNLACSFVSRTTLDANENSETITALAIGSDGLGLITFFDQKTGKLKVLHCTDLVCSSADQTEVDFGNFSSISIGADGLGLISYYEPTASDLKIAHCSNLACSVMSIVNLDSAGDVGRTSSITIDEDGLPIISYADSTHGDLKFARCNDPVCSSATIRAMDHAGSVGIGSSITTGSDRMTMIAYFDSINHDLKVIHCSNKVCLPYVRQR